MASTMQSLRKRVVVICVAFAAGPFALAQSASVAADAKAKLPQFEVVSIKPAEAGKTVMTTKVQAGGTVMISGYPLKTVIEIAFNLGYWQLSGGEDWMGKEEYVIEAKPMQGTPPQPYDMRHSLFSIEDPRLRQMLQAMLIDRFQLRFHYETKIGPVYLLERTDKPFPLRPVSAKHIESEDRWGEISRMGGDEWFIFDTSMPQLARFASTMVFHRPILDRTGIDGSFNYRWKMLSANPGPESDQQMSDFNESFKMLLKEIGLRVVPSTGPVETFVIDHAEPPSAN
jgi:uncharacterized protein (TIGR03435 family)